MITITITKQKVVLLAIEVRVLMFDWWPWPSHLNVVQLAQ